MIAGPRQTGIRNLTAKTKDHKARRVAQLGASGTGDSFALSPKVFRLMIRKTNLGVAYRNHEGVKAVSAA